MNLDSLLHKQPSRTWSSLQEAIFASSGPLIIQAVAGSGKTTTIVEMMNRKAGDSLFLAFNKAIANDLCGRVSGATVLTLNALGHRILTRKLPSAKLDQWRMSKRLRQIMSSIDYKDFGSQCVRAISLVKSSGIFSPSASDFLEIMLNYELEIPTDLLSPMARFAERAWQDMERNLETFDFDDQLYIPVRENWTFPLFDAVFVDEAQDLSTIQHMMLEKLVMRGALLVAVGDRNQAIYGFRGASSGSMDLLKATFSLQELPLSISYRCPRSIIELAQQIVPHIQPSPGAPDGQVILATTYPQTSVYSREDLIVCRNNAPIFSLALEFVRNGLPCRVMSNFLEVLERFIETFDCKTSKDLRIKLDLWFEKEKTACETFYPGRLAGIEDRYETLRAFAERFTTVDEIIRTIRSLASSQNGPRISTVHRAKGLEAENVFILRPDLLPSPRARSEAQLQAEANLKYVAITRAKNSLTFLPGES